MTIDESEGENNRQNRNDILGKEFFETGILELNNYISP